MEELCSVEVTMQLMVTNLVTSDLDSCPGKQQHYSRKDSADSGISGNMSRKTSTTSQLSCSSIAEEPTEETIKEETVFVEPDDDLCEKITQQVGNGSIFVILFSSNVKFDHFNKLCRLGWDIYKF
jgi:hypothetical protein